MARNNSFGATITNKPNRGDNVLGVIPNKRPTNPDRPQSVPGVSLGDTTSAPTIGATKPSTGLPVGSQIGWFAPPNAPVVGGVVETPKEENPYLQYLEEFESQMNSMADAYRQQLAKMYGEQAGIINDQYDKSANTAYIQYKQNQRDLPESLSSAGITGGATESANIKLQSAYGNNLAENESDRNNDLFSAKQGYDEAGADYQRQLNSQLASAYQQAHQMAAAWEDEQREKKEAAWKEEAAKAEQKALAERNNSIRREELALNRKGKITQNWYDETGRYRWQVIGTNKAEAKKQAAANQALLEQSMALADQGYNVGIKDGAIYTSSKKKLTSNYGGYGGSGGSGGSKSTLPDVGEGDGGGNTGNKKKTKLKLNLAKVNKYLNKYGGTILSDPHSVVKDLDKQLKSGELTEREADYIYGKIPTVNPKKGKRKKKNK